MSKRLALLRRPFEHRNGTRPIEEDGGAAVVTYNDELERLGANGKNTWFKAPWLFAEYVRKYFFSAVVTDPPFTDAICECGAWCGTPSDRRRYRLIRSYFALTVHWHEFDPFLTQKMDAFRGSGDAIYSLFITFFSN